MKRPLLIANGAFVSLATVMFATTPDFTKSSTIPTIPVSDPTPTKTNINPGKIVSTPTKPNVKVTKQPVSSIPSETVNTNPTPVQTTSSQPAPKLINGSFAGDPIDISYGIMQVKITIQDSKIIDAQAIQYPNSGKSASLNQAAIATLRQETLTAQSAAISGVSGASYTSYGWYKSLVSAIAKSGL